jgi:hypothetical protein
MGGISKNRKIGEKPGDRAHVFIDKGKPKENLKENLGTEPVFLLTNK